MSAAINCFFFFSGALVELKALEGHISLASEVGSGRDGGGEGAREEMGLLAQWPGFHTHICFGLNWKDMLSPLESADWIVPFSYVAF